MKQLEVQILGQSYLLGCPEGGEARLLEAVERVDTAMCKIRDAGKVRARDRIAVLAALNLAFDLSAQNEAAAQVPSSIASGKAPQAPEPSTPHSAPVGDSDVLLHSLLERLDAALGEDGRLL
ncbi:cell division protein ZapA [Rhodoferax aquaticus]|uniref:Cell division protein ZapA n=1 Tax=Rhodoferax aquaticus TaxID=2527691 RepID=A0A515EN61_9BURK|nr:cell division protein ZapA [Rhodoferax aquaticus]QDL54099.1 cell division protein ZapA [Rhodoferax aquaticus]